jgi:hypothetical protein
MALDREIPLSLCQLRRNIRRRDAGLFRRFCRHCRAAADQHVRLLQAVFDLWALRQKLADQMAGIKFFNVFGPNEYHKGDMTSVIFKAFHHIRETGRVRLFKSYRPSIPTEANCGISSTSKTA